MKEHLKSNCFFSLSLNYSALHQFSVWAHTLQTLKYAPEDAEAVLLLLHASPAPAAVERALLHGFDGAATLALRLRTRDRAEVALPARHALSHRAVLGAAGGLPKTLLAGLHAVQVDGPVRRPAAVTPQGEQRVWRRSRHTRDCLFGKGAQRTTQTF